MKKVIVISDSFKGSLDSGTIAQIAADCIPAFFPGCQVIGLPVADGGEGTVDCFLKAVGGTRVTVEATGPWGEPAAAFYGRIGDTAVVEMAAAAGLPMAGDRLDPSRTTTYGVGQLLLHAVEHGARHLVLGLGGSATNDGGMGLLTALGYRFLDVNDQELPPTGKSLPLLATIDGSSADKRLATCHFTAACDVRNPLTGPMGAAHIFAPQKGADAHAVQYLDHGLAQYAHIIHQFCGCEISTLPGAGAAGGVGGGIAALLGACLKPGCEIILDLAGFDDIITDADYIITNSFHATMFSLYFNKSFITFKYEQGRGGHMNTRLTSILSQTNLTERFLPFSEMADSKKILDTPIDWDAVNQQLASLRDIGVDFLKKTL